MSTRADVTIKANNAAMKKLEVELIKRNYRYNILRNSCTADMDSFVVIEIRYIRTYYFEKILDEIIELCDEKIKFQAIFVYGDGGVKEYNSDDDDDDFNTMYTETIVHYE